MLTLRNPLSDRNQCVIGIAIQRPFGRPQVPRPARRWAIVDTGTSASLIQRTIADELKLEEVAPATIEHPGYPEPIACMTTFADLILFGDNGTSHRMSKVLAIAPGIMKPPVILGMDAFGGGQLHIDFGAGWWSLTLPDQTPPT